MGPCPPLHILQNKQYLWYNRAKPSIHLYLSSMTGKIIQLTRSFLPFDATFAIIAAETLAELLTGPVWKVMASLSW